MSAAAAAECNEVLGRLVNSSVESLDHSYAIGKIIGEGRFSKVYAGVGSASSVTGAGVQVALKEVDLGTLEEDEEAIEMLEAEVLALRRCAGADHVVALHEVIASEKEECVYLAMERVPGRELFELVEEQGELPVVLVKTLMMQLLTALEALAKHGVVHRDVKPENLMVTEGADGSSARLTLIDFGYAAILGEEAGSGGLLSGVAGSPEYAAPEVLSWLEVEADETGTVEGERYDAGCDVWSVGVTAHVLLSAELPFELPEEADEASLVAAARNVRLTFAKCVWQDEGMAAAREFVAQCMIADRHQRPSASKLLGHPWFGGPVLPTTVLPTKPPLSPQEEAPLPQESAAVTGGEEALLTGGEVAAPPEAAPQPLPSTKPPAGSGKTGGMGNGVGSNGVNAAFIALLEETVSIEETAAPKQSL